MIFEQDLPCMSQEAMEALLKIADWCISHDGTIIRMYSAERAPHVFPIFHRQVSHAGGFITHLDRVIN